MARRPYDRSVAPENTPDDDVPLMLIDPPYGGDEGEWTLFIQGLIDMKGDRDTSWLDQEIDSARSSLASLRNPAASVRPEGMAPGIKGRLEWGSAKKQERIDKMQIADQYREWAKCADRLGFTDFVSAEDGFRTELFSEAPWTNGAACGVYFWVAQDGETYVGQTVNARARLREHWRNHPDLAYASFQAVPDSLLNEREQSLIAKVCAEFPTRNIKHAIATESHVPFDNFVSQAESAAFVGGSLELPDLNWRELPLLEQKQAKKYERLERSQHSEAALKAFAIFASRVLPRAAATEARFWSVSLFVQCHLLRVNAGQQEVFTVQEGNDGNLYARVFSGLKLGTNSEGPMYQTQSYEALFPVESLERWLVGKHLLSCRELVVRLMRHTTTLNSGSHSPQVSRAALVKSLPSVAY